MNDTLELEQQPIQSCYVKPVPYIQESKIKKLVRRIKELVKPTVAFVRFDTRNNTWCVLDAEDKILHHFSYGVMKDVTFSARQSKKPVYKGCGPGIYPNIGIAYGTLYQDQYGYDSVGFHNLSFNGTNFLNQDGKIIERANYLRLLPERKSLYK